MTVTPREYIAEIDRSVNYIRGIIGSAEIPGICTVLGSGLSPLADHCEDKITVPYADIPGFPISTVEGHEGKLIIGTLEGKRVFMMSGRFHAYEGYGTDVCTFYVRVMSKLGVKTLILTNAAGGISPELKPPELMIITDHIGFFCISPLIGPNLDEFGVRFPDQSEVYDSEYVSLLEEKAREAGIRIHKGVYAYCKGPQYETPAEIRALKLWGADAVGMSTVPEAIVAAHCGMRTAAVSCITNFAAGLNSGKLSHPEVMMNAARASDDSCRLVKLFISSLN